MPSEGEKLPEESLPTLEEIDAAQAARDAELERERAEAEVKAAEEARQKARAVPLAAEHGEHVKAARGLHRRIRTKDASGVGERMKESEALRAEETGLAAELETAVAGFQEAKEYLAALEKRAEGRQETELADMLKQALPVAREKLAALDAPIARLETRLRSVRERQISPDEAAEYSGLRDEMETVLARIREIGEVTREGSEGAWAAKEPQVLEALEEEATLEGALRERIVEVVRREEGFARRESPRAEIMRRAVQRFITEEIDKQGINAITDPAAHGAALRELEEGIMLGLRSNSPDEESPNLESDDKRKLFYSGAVLRVLTVHPGMIASLDGYLSRSETGEAPPSRYGRQPQLNAEEVSRRHARQMGGFNQALSYHIDTINLFRTYSAEIDEKRNEVPIRMSTWDSAMSAGLWRDQRSNYFVRLGGPILPRAEQVGQEAFVAANDRYEADREAARKMEAQFLDIDIATYAKSLEEAENALKELQERVAEMKELERAANPPDRRAVSNELDDIGRPLYTLRDQRRSAERALERRGKGFHFLERRKYKNQIADYDAQIGTREARMKPLQDRMDAMRRAELELEQLRRRGYRLDEDIRQRESRVAELRSVLKDLQDKRVNYPGGAPESGK